jgi:large subunit ribosomal protein L3
MKFILGKKVGMTQVFKEDGVVVPVTRVIAGPCVITQIKKAGKVPMVQIGFGQKKVKLMNKPELGHLKGITANNDEKLTVRFLKDFRAEQEGLKKGDIFTAQIFAAGEKVQVIGTSKGKGFQGVVKRHHFRGQMASHGVKDQLRTSGSIGAGGVQRVFKGKRMAGRMGNDQVTIKNLEVVEVHPENNELLIKGAVPGGRNALLLISTNNGEIVIDKVVEPTPEVTSTITQDEKVEGTVAENVVAEVKVEEPTETVA